MQLFVVSETKRWPKNVFARQIKKLIFTYFKLNCSYVDAMLVYTEQARNFLSEHIPNMKIILVPAPVDTDLFKSDSLKKFYQNKL